MIPLHTTFIDVLRSPVGSDFDEPYSGVDPAADWTRAFEGVRAVIDRPAGSQDVAGGQQNIADYRLVCDEIDLHYTDRVYDQSSTRTFRVVWQLAYPGSHVEAGLRDVEGEV